MFGDLNDCYGRALQQELAKANRLEQELIEAGNRYYAEMIEEEMNEEEIFVPKYEEDFLKEHEEGK